MSNELEKFINNNREEFDSEEMKIRWIDIESKFIHKKSRIASINLHSWAVAAAGAIIFISAMFFFNNDNKTAPIALQPADLPSQELTNDVDPVYTNLMDQFVILINVKENELKKNQKMQPQLYKQFLLDNNRLDSSYDYLKSQLKASPNKEVLLDAMIQNLQLKIDILNRQLQIIKQSKLKKTDNENKSI